MMSSQLVLWLSKTCLGRLLKGLVWIKRQVPILVVDAARAPIFGCASEKGIWTRFTLKTSALLLVR